MPARTNLDDARMFAEEAQRELAKDNVNLAVQHLAKAIEHLANALDDQAGNGMPPGDAGGVPR